MIQIIATKESKGRISRLKNHSVWITLIDTCADSGGCSLGCCSCSKKKQTRTVLVHLDDTDTFPIGTIVTVKFSEINEFIGALIVFGIPLLSAFLSLLLWYIFNPEKIESGISLLSAGLSFTGGFFIVRCIDHYFRHCFPSSILSTH